MAAKKIKETVRDAVKEYVQLLHTPTPTESLFERAQMFMSTLYNRAGIEAAVRFVDELHAIEKKMDMLEDAVIVDAFFVHMELVRLLAKDKRIEEARAEARRYAFDDMKDDSLPVAQALLEIAYERSENPAHLEFALRELRSSPTDSTKVELLLSIVRRFRRKDAMQLALETADALERTGPHLNASIALAHIAEHTQELSYWKRAVFALSKDPDNKVRQIGYRSLAQGLIRCCGKPRATQFAATCPQSEFQNAMRQYMNSTSPDLN